MFSLNAIGLETEFLNEIVQSEKEIFSHFNFLIYQFTSERIKLPERFWHYSMCFQIMHIVSKFQFFIHISIVVNYCVLDTELRHLREINSNNNQVIRLKYNWFNNAYQ